jgi:hypothetical protein
MKKFILLAMTCLVVSLTAGCVSPPSYYKNQINRNLVQENWLKHINLNDRKWIAGADRWFYTDEPRSFNEYARRAPEEAGITQMMVRVPDFNTMVVSGPYKVQIMGRQLHNTLFILGTNNATRHVAVDITGSTLNIHPAADCTKDACGNKDVIIRIGVRELNSLTANGNGFIEGKGITSSGLTITSNGPNRVLLTGMMNVQRIVQNGPGNTTVIGAYSPNMDIAVPGNGNVNVSGHVGIRNVMKKGSGIVNIIGADTDGLKIASQGTGIVAIAGYANLKKISVSQNSRVYIYWINSDGIYVSLRDNARLGLAGSAHNMDLDVANNSRFEGKYLRTDAIYVNTRNAAHANVLPQQKLFANASGDSTVYFFGSPNVVSRYTSGNALVIPIFNDTCPVAPKMRMYKDSGYKDQAVYK